MSTKQRTISQINLVARRFDETLKFYRLLGLDIPAPMTQPPGSLHAPADLASGFEFQVDNEHHARIYNAAWRRPTASSSLLLSVSVGSREEVDSTYAKLIAAGYEGRQPPYDAFWGSRFAIVADPEGNDVGLMSPAERRFEFWPPVDSPAP
jgi:predicted lactoylglutathione lyase